MGVNFTNSHCQHTRAVIKGHKLQHLQWLGMLGESYMFLVNISIIAIFHLQSNKFVKVVRSRKQESELIDSSDALVKDNFHHNMVWTATESTE